MSNQINLFQSTHSLRSATVPASYPSSCLPFQSTHSLRSATASTRAHVTSTQFQSTHSLRSATIIHRGTTRNNEFQSTHSLRSATGSGVLSLVLFAVSIHALLAECDCLFHRHHHRGNGFNPRTPCGVRHPTDGIVFKLNQFQSTHSLRSATAPNLIHCYSTKQIILCANLPKKTVIARLLFLSIYLSIFYSQCITPIADLPGNSCELEVGAQAMFNSL